jgi:hypothetical protein
MSTPEPPDNQRPESATRRNELADQMRELSLRLDSFDARDEERHAELTDRLNTTLRALELIHDDDPRARRRLRDLRAGADYEAAFTASDPLVSVVIPTWNRADTLIELAIPSALNQTHPNIEVIVIGDASPPEIEQAISRLGDPRVKFQNLTIRGPYEQEHYRSWLASGTPGFNAGVAMASGLWIAPLGDDDEFEPHHVERLLHEARDRRLEFVYGRGRVLLPDGREMLLGEFPPRLTQVGLQSVLYHAGLGFMELELGHALFDKPNDWGLVHRMMRVGVRMAMVNETTVVYRPSLRAQTPRPDQSERRPTASQDGSFLERDSTTRRLDTRISDLELELINERTLTSDLYRRLDEVRHSRSWQLTAPLRRLRGRTKQN